MSFDLGRSFDIVLPEMRRDIESRFIYE